MALYDRENDAHDTEDRVRGYFKYGASIGISATPQAYVNGVMLDQYPTSVDEWKDVFNSLFPSS